MTMDTNTAPSRNRVYRFSRRFLCAESLMIVGFLWVAILGCSQQDSSVTATDSCTAPVVKSSEGKPSLVGPQDFKVDGNGSRVVLKWDASSNAFGYRIYIGTISRQYHQLADVGLMTEAAVNNLLGDTTYYFAVTSYNSGGESCLSNEVSAHLPPG